MSLSNYRLHPRHRSQAWDLLDQRTNASAFHLQVGLFFRTPLPSGLSLTLKLMRLSPSPTIDLSTIPELPSQEEIMPPDHPHHLLPPAPAGWTTTIIEHSICDGWWPWSKKGVIKLTVRSFRAPRSLSSRSSVLTRSRRDSFRQFAFPPLPSGIPLAHPIPFLLHLTSRPSQPSNPSPFQTLNLTLNRTVFTLARGSGQLVPQRGLKPFWSINVGNWERGQSGDRNITTAGAIEIPVDGGVSFGTERTKGMLGCEVSFVLPLAAFPSFLQSGG